MERIGFNGVEKVQTAFREVYVKIKQLLMGTSLDLCTGKNNVRKRSKAAGQGLPDVICKEKFTHIHKLVIIHASAVYRKR